jgi:hypothetical protein
MLTLADGTTQRLCVDCDTYLSESAFSPSCKPNNRYVCRACMTLNRRRWAKTAKAANYIVVASRSREKRRCTLEHVEPSKVLSAEIDLLLDLAQHRSVLDEPVPSPVTTVSAASTALATLAASLDEESDPDNDDDDAQPSKSPATTTTTTTASETVSETVSDD